MEMNQDRRRVMLLGGAMLTFAGRRGADAVEMPKSLTLEAQTSGATADGSLPGLGYRRETGPPIIRLTQNEAFRLSLKNGIKEATALDLDGLRGGSLTHIGRDPDGAKIAPGATASFDIKPTQSGTAWFHAPFKPGWTDQTARGLGGVIIVEETMPPAVDDDVVLFLTDRGMAKSEIGNRLWVNGKDPPETRTYLPNSRLRLRLVNGSTRLALTASFAGARALVIAIDGQPCELFRPLNDRLPIGPGARFDVLCDLSKTAARDDAAAFTLTLGSVEPLAMAAVASVFVAKIGGEPRPDRAPIAALAPNPALPTSIPLEKATRVEIAIQKTAGSSTEAATFSINGLTSVELPKTPLFEAKRGTAIVLGLANRTSDLIGFRLHGQAMRVLHVLDDGWEPYWRDSILVPSGKTFHVAFMAEVPGRFLMESPFFDQAVSGLRRWFAVL